MLIDIPIGQPADPTLALVLGVVAKTRGTANTIECLGPGLYKVAHWSFDHLIPPDRLKERYPDLGPGEDALGVCDYPEQIVERLTSLANPDRQFCAAFVRLDRKDESPSGGWRWHKWGTYIGDQDPQHEYLYYEKHIDTVWTYHVYELHAEKA